MTYKLIWLSILSSLILFTQSTPAAASKKSVNDILSMVDDNLLKVEDTTYQAEVSVIRDGKTIKTMRFEAILKGLIMKKITFLSPGDVRGMVVLTTRDDNTYVYMPSYKRVRRVASHVQDQGFMGTDISAEEMGSASLSRGFEGTIVRETDQEWILRLTPKKTMQSMYDHMMVTVSKQYGAAIRIESYNAAGVLVKSQERSDFQTFGVITLPVKMVFTDHRTGSKTVIQFSDCKVNQGISDSTFTTRSLMRQ